MAVKSHGPHRKTREKFRRTGLTPISRYIKQFKIGDRVVIDINSSSHKGMPFKRFQGLLGNVVEKKGRAFIVEIKDGNKTKKVITPAEHLKVI
jgi:large subunit ribosomal protein L21e